MQITIRYVSGEEDKYTLNTEQLMEFENWLINGKTSDVFVYKSDRYTSYIFKSKIECVDYLR